MISNISNIRYHNELFSVRPYRTAIAATGSVKKARQKLKEQQAALETEAWRGAEPVAGSNRSAGPRFRGPADFCDIFLYFSHQGCYTVLMSRTGPGPHGQKNRERGCEGA